MWSLAATQSSSPGRQLMATPTDISPAATRRRGAAHGAQRIGMRRAGHATVHFIDRILSHSGWARQGDGQPAHDIDFCRNVQSARILWSERAICASLLSERAICSFNFEKNVQSAHHFCQNVQSAHHFCQNVQCAHHFGRNVQSAQNVQSARGFRKWAERAICTSTLVERAICLFNFEKNVQSAHQFC